jgi:hypothetical protein
MTANEFRKLALGLPEASEAAHMGHPDFRVRGKIFAALGPDEDWGMVKLTADEQASLVHDEPEVFEPFGGAWGRRGLHEGLAGDGPCAGCPASVDRGVVQYRPQAACPAVRPRVRVVRPQRLPLLPLQERVRAVQCPHRVNSAFQWELARRPSRFSL